MHARKARALGVQMCWPQRTAAPSNSCGAQTCVWPAAEDVTDLLQGDASQQQELQQQLGLARAMLRDTVRADLVELHRLAEQVEQLRSWLLGQSAATGPEPVTGWPAPQLL